MQSYTVSTLIKCIKESLKYVHRTLYYVIRLSLKTHQTCDISVLSQQFKKEETLHVFHAVADCFICKEVKFYLRIENQILYFKHRCFKELFN